MMSKFFCPSCNNDRAKLFNIMITGGINRTHNENFSQISSNLFIGAANFLNKAINESHNKIFSQMLGNLFIRVANFVNNNNAINESRTEKISLFMRAANFVNDSFTDCTLKIFLRISRKNNFLNDSYTGNNALKFFRSIHS